MCLLRRATAELCVLCPHNTYSSLHGLSTPSHFTLSLCYHLNAYLVCCHFILKDYLGALLQKKRKKKENFTKIRSGDGNNKITVNNLCKCIPVHLYTDVLTYTHSRCCTENWSSQQNHTQIHTSVHVHTLTHTQARVADPNPGTHTFLIPHNCFQSKGSCLSGPRRGLIARYKILRRVGKAAGRQKEREGERDMVCTYFSSLSPLTFFSSCTWCRNLGSVNKG